VDKYVLNVLRTVPASKLIVVPIVMGLYFALTQSGIPMEWFTNLLQAMPFELLQSWGNAIEYQAHFEQIAVDNTAIWHALFPDDYTRHGIRQVGQGILVGMFTFTVTMNLLGKKHLRRINRKPNPLDRLEMFLRIPNYKDNKFRADKGLPPISGKQAAAAWLFWLWVYSFPIIWGLLHGFAALSRYLIGAHPEYSEVIITVFTGNWIYLIVGFFAAPLAKRPLGPVLADAIDALAERRVIHQRPERRWHKVFYTPQYRELVRRKTEAGIAAAEVDQAMRRGRLLAYSIITSAVLLALFLLGWYIKVFILHKWF
jgi:hypothetical protein